MPKNIVLCCDGTKNEFGSENTNVVRLYSVLRHEPGTQVTYYHPGLGTMGASAALTAPAREWTKLLGLAFGYGISQHLVDLYEFVMRNYEPGDRLYVFGFSRGAYTARALCSLFRLFGLVRFDDAILLPYMIRLLKHFPKSADVAESFKETFSTPDLKPHFVGVWDTVSAVGGIYNPLTVPFTADNPDIQVGRHAIAIDERRAFYRTNLWRYKQDPNAPKERDIQQVWFAGVHSDIGGGYPEAESGLAKITLEWMAGEAIPHGLLIDETKLAAVLGGQEPFAKPSPTAKLHAGLGPWWAVEWLPKKHYNYATGKTGWIIPWGHRRTIAKGSLVHESVFDRLNATVDPPYRPKNLVIEPGYYQVVKTAAR